MQIRFTFSSILFTLLVLTIAILTFPAVSRAADCFSQPGDQCTWAWQCNSPNVGEAGWTCAYWAAPGPLPIPGRVCCHPAPGTTLSCSQVTGGYCSNNNICPTDWTWAGGDFDCSNTCCRPISCFDLTDTNGYCSKVGHNCTNTQANDYADSAAQSSCDWLCCNDKQTCNTGSSPVGGCNAYGMAFNTCGYPGGYQNNNYTTYVHPNCGRRGSDGNGYTCTPSSQCNQVGAPATSCNPGFINNCNGGGGYTCYNGNTCVTNIYVHVYTDYNHTATNNGGGKSGVTITDNGGNFPQTDANGNVTFTAKAVGNYTISETVPANFQATNATSQGVSLTNNAGNATVNFYLTPLYSISGRVFTDKNKNQRFDGGDTGYGGGTIHITGPTAVADMTAAADGTWSTPTNLLSGNYTVSYTTSLSAGYRFTTPSSYVVTVGNPAGSPACSVGGSLDASCGGTNNGSVSNLDVGLTNEVAWNQSACYDVRDDSGTYTDPIPPAPSCGGVTGAYDSITNGNCSTGAGIIFTCDATPDFGLGSANANNWHVGGPAATDKECFTGAGLDVVRTSYDYLLTTARESNITPTDMNSVAVCGAGGLGNCTLPSTLTKGVYKAEGDVALNTYTFPVDPTGNPEGFIFLIHGNLYLNGNIIIPQGSVAVFSASGNIIVDKSVGNLVTSTTDPAINNPNLEGLYSADGSFIVNSYIVGTNVCNADGTPLDKKLNIVGSVVTNAAKAGGSFLNNRDLCVYDLQCSSVSAGDNNGLALSYLLTLFADGKFLNHKLFNWQELRP